MSLKRRLEKLESAQSKHADPERYVFDPNGTRPKDLMYRVHVKSIERYQARAEGLEPPPYSQEEIEHMREEDLKSARGEGIVAELRDAPGWQPPQAQEVLDEWEATARRRVELTEGVSRELWHQVYEEQ